MQQFVWWIGKVVDRNDPEQLGRVRVRIHNIHGSEAELPTETLHWSHIVMQPTNAAIAGVGLSPTGIQVNSTVFGWFLDGSKAQYPIVFGTYHGEGDVAGLVFGSNTTRKELIGPEPTPAYNAQYPYNKVFQSESGHVIEVDDTPNFERLHTYHRSGTYQEIDQDGRRVNKIVGDDFLIVQKDQTVYIQGNLNITVVGNVRLSASEVTITAPITNISGDLNVGGSITAGGDVVGAEISLDNHVHGGVEAGGATTGAPQ